MKNKTPLKIITFILFLVSLSLGIIGYKYKVEHPEKLPYIVLGDKNGYEFMNIYKEETEELCFNNNCNGELYLVIMNESANAQIVSGNKNTKYLLINDNKAKLINLIDRTEQVLSDIPLGTYSLILEDGNPYTQDNLEFDALGISFSSGTRKGFYNLKTNKIMYDGIYDNISVINKDYLINTSDKLITLLSLNEEKEIINMETNNSTLKKLEVEENKVYITLQDSSNETIYRIYDINTSKITGEIKGTYEKIIRTETKIIAIKDQEAIIYNLDGSIYRNQILSASDKYNMVDNYYVSMQKSELLLINLETLEEIELMPITSNSHIDTIYKDVITENGENTQVLRIVVRELNSTGQITKTFNILYNLETKEIKIEED